MADTRITFNMKDAAGNILWSLQGQGPEDGEMLVGIGQAIYLCAWYRNIGQPYYSFDIDGKGEQYLHTDPKTRKTTWMYDHFEITDIHNMRNRMGINHFLIKNLQAELHDMDRRYGGSYGWLSKEGLFEGQGYIGTVTMFRTPRYIQGFIMGCNACGVDFRTMVHGKPFKVAADGTVTYFDIEGYPMTNAPDLPAQL